MGVLATKPKKKDAIPKKVVDQWNKELLTAAAKGDVKSVKRALKKGAEVDAKGKYGITPVMEAAKNGHIEVVKLLIKKNAKTGLEESYGMNALMFACQEGHIGIVKLLLKKGDDINAVNSRSKMMPLMYAAERGHLEIVKLLWDKGAELDARNGLGQTAFMIACENGQIKVADFLRRYGGAGDLETKDRFGKTALLLAAEKGQIETVKFLLGEYADLRAKDEDGNNALMLSAGADLEGMKVLRTDLVGFFLSKGLGVDEKNKDGETALMHAINDGHTETVRLLLSRNATVNYENDLGMIPLQFAAARGWHIILKDLLAKGADVNKQNTVSGYTALMAAAEEGNYKVVKILVNTPGIKLDLRNHEGLSALDLAKEGGKGNIAVVELLERAGAK